MPIKVDERLCSLRELATSMLSWAAPVGTMSELAAVDPAEVIGGDEQGVDTPLGILVAIAITT